MKKQIKKLIPKWFFKRTVNYYHWLQALSASLLNGRPGRGMMIVGITGTSGKSTTTAMVSHILNEAGIKTAHFTTTGAFWGGEQHLNVSRMTTEPPATLYKRLRLAQKAGDQAVVLESTAHAVVQHRLAFINYTGVIFTNLSHDHLDYFKTMEAYQASKKGLFKLAAKSGGWGIVNHNDPASADVGSPLPADKRISYGKGGDIFASDIKETSKSTSMTVNYRGKKYPFTLPMIGSFNVDNALAALAAGVECGIAMETCIEAMSTFTGVVGRMEKLSLPNGATVVIDYAHTPRAFDLVLSEIRRVTKGRLITVFGGYGEKDQTIRHPMGKIAGGYADEIILTEDDPRSEKIAAINQDIIGGIHASARGKKLPITEIDIREDAIAHALKMAKKDDVVACLGKGHERTIEYYPKPKPWNERGAVETAIKQLK